MVDVMLWVIIFVVFKLLEFIGVVVIVIFLIVFVIIFEFVVYVN